MEVLQLVARGMAKAGIGRRLFISEATVEVHLLRASGKLGVSDHTAAAATAIQRAIFHRPAGNRPCDHNSGKLLALDQLATRLLALVTFCGSDCAIT